MYYIYNRPNLTLDKELERRASKETDILDKFIEKSLVLKEKNLKRYKINFRLQCFM